LAKVAVVVSIAETLLPAQAKVEVVVLMAEALIPAKVIPVQARLLLKAVAVLAGATLRELVNLVSVLVLVMVVFHPRPIRMTHQQLQRCVFQDLRQFPGN
jgi:hypothetical protein